MKIIEAITLLKNACLENEANIQKELHLTPAEFNGLISIEDGEVISCQSLSKKMGLSISRGSRVINKLIDKQYLKGKKLPDDKRCSQISLTKKGQGARLQMMKSIDECEKKITATLSNDQIIETKKCLLRLISLIEK